MATVESDYKAIKTAVMSYYADTGEWPKDQSDGLESGLVNDPKNVDGYKNNKQGMVIYSGDTVYLIISGL